MICCFDLEHKCDQQHHGTLIISDGSIHKYNLTSLLQTTDCVTPIPIPLKLTYSQYTGKIAPDIMQQLCFLLYGLSSRPSLPIVSTTLTGYCLLLNGKSKKTILNINGNQNERHLIRQLIEFMA